MRTLVTGFGSFQGVPENPSAELARMSGHSYEVLEVSYQAAQEFIDNLNPDSFDTWLMLGVAASRDRVSMELFASNKRSSVDVRGVAPGGDGELGLHTIRSTFWTKSLVDSLLRQHPVELRVSVDAGAYLCNFLSYEGLKRFPEKRIGFLHVVMPSEMSLDIQSGLIEQILKEAEALG